jgi:hypothetical protein
VKEKKPMMKQLRTLLVAAAMAAGAALGAALILSCNALFEPSIEAAGGSGETGRVVLSVSTGGAAPARTVQPAETLDIFNRYELVFNKGGEGIGGVTVPAPDTDGIDGAGVSQELSVGDWTATVTAYRKFTVTDGTEQEYKAAQGSSPIKVAVGQITEVTVSLVPLPLAQDNTVKGIFTYKVIFPDDAEAALTFGNEEPLTLASGIEVSEEKDIGYYDLFITATRGALSAGLAAKVHIYSGLESKAEFTFDEDDFVKSVYLAGTLSLPEGVAISSGTINAYSDESYSSQIGTASVSPGDGSWLIPIPLADIPEGPVYLKAEVTGGDGEAYVAMGSTTGAVPEKGVQDIALVSDTTAPGEVSSPSGNLINGQATLSWYDPEDEDLDHIEISWTSDGGEGGPVNAYKPSWGRYNTITIEGLTDGTVYTFTLKAVDKAGNKNEGISITLTLKTLEDIESISITKATTPPRFKEDYVETEISDVTELDLTGLTVTANFGGVWHPVTSLVTGAPETYLSLTEGNDFNTAGQKTITVTVNGKTATFQVTVRYIYTVTINTPALAEGTVEQPSGNTIFCATGAVFTAGVGVSGGPTPTLTWTLEGQNLDTGTAIDNNGSLTVAPADQGKTVTVKATSPDTRKYDTMQVTVASVMPSALYGSWPGEADINISDNEFKISRWSSWYYPDDEHIIIDVTSWEGALNEDPESKGDYPGGYNLTGRVRRQLGFYNLLPSGSGNGTVTLFLSNDGKARYAFENDFSGWLWSTVFTKR